jgi:putative ABC transport system permease protein
MVQQLVVEGLVLAVLATIAAVPLAMWGTTVLKALVPTEIPRLNEAAINPVVIGFMIAAALATAALFSAAPALQVSRLNLVDALKQNAVSGGPARRCMRRALVIAEIAFAFVLLAGAGLMTRTLFNLVTVDAGFDGADVLTAPISMAGTDNANTQALAVSFEELLNTVQAQPGVESVGFTSHVPMGGNGSRIGIAIEGRQPDTDEPVRAHWRVITPGYFAAMRIRLSEGRFPTDVETRDRAAVAVINRTAAQRYWGGTDPVGQRLRVLTPEWREIIGVVDDVLHWGPANPANPEVYLPGFRTPTNLVVRAAPNAALSPGAIRDEIGKVAPESALASFRTMDDIRGQTVAAPRFYLLLLGIFASVGLALAVVGVYAVISYGVAQSRHDIGIRMALGAHGHDVARLFVADGVVLTGIGIALGVIGAFAVTRVMAGLLFGISATDLTTFIAVALIMAVTALAASYLPARRAASLDPLIALRQD